MRNLLIALILLSLVLTSTAFARSEDRYWVGDGAPQKENPDNVTVTASEHISGPDIICDFKVSNGSDEAISRFELSGTNDILPSFPDKLSQITEGRLQDWKE